MAFDFGIVLLFFLLGGGFVFINLVLGKFFRPDNPYPDKNEIYECGERPIGDAWIQFNPRFYLVALIFLIFDVEIAFVFPVATIYKEFIDQGLGGLAFLELTVFMSILVLGLLYVWRKGDLQWVKTIAKPPLSKTSV